MKKLLHGPIKIIALLMLISTSFSLSGQDISTSKIAWRVNQGNDLAARKNFSYSSVFKTKGDGTIEWQQKNGTYNTVFKISSTEGSWSDINKQGKIVYNASERGGDVKITFERSVSGISISLKVLPAGPEYRFQVDNTRIED